MTDIQNRQSFSERVAQKFIDQLEAGTAPWQKPWDPSLPDGTRPLNASSNKTYSGINSLWLGIQSFTDPRWMTYRQASEMGAQVRRGEQGTSVEYWQWEKEEKNKETGKKQTVKLERPKIFYATVFNAEQMDGLAPFQPPVMNWVPNERAEALLNASGAWIEHRTGDRAFYSPASDKIILPLREQFRTSENYLATALHELGHWSGHSSRLNRDLSGTWQSASYAIEELRAEISAYMTCSTLGVSTPGVDDQHAAYVKSWVKALKDDPREIFRAAADAEKIHRFVMEFDLQRKLEQEQAATSEAKPTRAAEAARTARRPPVQHHEREVGMAR